MSDPSSAPSEEEPATVAKKKDRITFGRKVYQWAWRWLVERAGLKERDPHQKVIRETCEPPGNATTLPQRIHNLRLFFSENYRSAEWLPELIKKLPNDAPDEPKKKSETEPEARARWAQHPEWLKFVENELDALALGESAWRPSKLVRCARS